jgi:DNA-binding MarR family transcriptional regulator
LESNSSNQRKGDPVKLRTRALLKPPRLSYLIRRAQLLIYVNLADCLREHRLTPMQYMMLNVSRRGGEMSSADLARRFAVTPQSVNEMIAALQRKHLITRKVARENRRILRISLTPDGARLLQKCDRQVDRMEDRLFGALSRTDLTVVRSALTALIDYRRP